MVTFMGNCDIWEMLSDKCYLYFSKYYMLPKIGLTKIETLSVPVAV